MKFYTTHIENAKVCGASILNTILLNDSAAPVCFYNADYQVTYADEYWQYDAGAAMGLGSVYGMQTYFSSMFSL
jgi:hypothetical protein